MELWTWTMADGKWITELTAATPVADAARHALTVRLQVVHDHLPLALYQTDKDPEYVHQLRVGTRRAAAALRIFSLCLPEKEFRAARRQLKRIRRAAGAARDWDVFLTDLISGEKQPEKRRPGIDFLIGYGLGQRAAAQERLREVSPNYPFDLDRLLAETVAAVHKPRAESDVRSLLDLARPLLSELLGHLHEAASGDLEDYDRLHQVRIAGKRLRYAMEIFACCFGPCFRETLYAAVEEMQEILGRANDSHVAIGRLEQLRNQIRSLRPSDWRRYRAGLEGILRFHRERLPEERRRFDAWWARWQQSAGETAFTDLLRAEASARCP